MIRLLGLLLVAVPPLVGAWLASSLTALAGGPPWLAAGAGVLLFPVLPIAWELGWLRRRANKRAARASAGKPVDDRPPLFAPYARFLLRTLVVSAVFIGFLLAWFPERSFLALSVRGDWFLERGAPSADPSLTRRALFGAARGLEWLYLAARDDPYRDAHDDKPLPAEKPLPAPVTPPPGPVPDVGSAADAGVPDPGAGAEPAPRYCATLEDGRKVCVDAPVLPDPPPAPATADAGTPSPRPSPDGDLPEGRPQLAQLDARWPQPAKLHPALERMSSADDASMESVVKYLSARTHPGADRVRALHDWVADRIAYDTESFFANRFPPQDPATVFRTRLSVCAGYSRLLARLGELAGEEIVYLHGDAKGYGGIGGHAWNAAKIDGGWVLLDATWNSGGVGQTKRFEKGFSTNYLFAPPAFFVETHFPSDHRWQLLEPPIDRGAFLRSQAKTPAFYAARLEMVTPRDALSDVDGDLEIRLKNPDGHAVVATACQDGTPCTQCGSLAPTERLYCPLPRRGSHRVHLMVKRPDEPQQLAATFEVNRR